MASYTNFHTAATIIGLIVKDRKREIRTINGLYTVDFGDLFGSSINQYLEWCVKEGLINEREYKDIRQEIWFSALNRGKISSTQSLMLSLRRGRK